MDDRDGINWCMRERIETMEYGGIRIMQGFTDMPREPDEALVIKNKGNAARKANLEKTQNPVFLSRGQ